MAGSAAASSVAATLHQLELTLSSALMQLSYGPSVQHRYDPVVYASVPHRRYLDMYCHSSKPLLLLGMNPGPWGMAQTGVPFGHVGRVRDWLGISGPVDTPAEEHPKRPIQGFQCKRSEVSGERLWALLHDLSHGNAGSLAASGVLLYNYCPLMLLAGTGTNVAPADLKVEWRRPLEDACDRSLREVVTLLGVREVVALGGYAFDRTSAALKDKHSHVQIHKLLHPSPRNPSANQDWISQAKTDLEKAGVLHYFSTSFVDSISPRV